MNGSDDVATCKEFSEFAEETNSQTPLTVDNSTELILVTVHCESKIITYKKRIFAHTSVLLGGWEARKQLQNTQLHCNKIGLSRTLGWIARDEIYNNDYTFAATFTTSPEDCKD